VTVDLGDPVRRGGVQPPFQNVALDEHGAGNLTLQPSLCLRPDVDQERPVAHRCGAFPGADPLQPRAGGGEHLVDGHEPALARCPPTAAACSTSIPSSGPHVITVS